MYSFLANIESEKNFEEMIELMKAHKCVAFIGAGLSVGAGYRSWERGIFDESSLGYKSGVPGLLKLSALSEDDIKDCIGDLSEIAFRCKKAFTAEDDYLEFLRKEFGPEYHEPYLLEHSIIWKSNFRHVLTTNFDKCLHNATSDPECKDVITYPEIMLKGDRTLCHIHGRAFLLDGEDPIVEKYHLRNLVYTKDGYKAAYEDEKEIETFLYEITRKHSLVFLGFSMNDENFRRTFNAIIGARTRKNKRKAGIMGVAPSELPNFVFLDVPEKAPHQSDPDFMLVMVDYNKKVSDLQGEGFRVVSFKRLDTSFLGLKRALQQIEQKIRYAALPKQKEPTFEVTDSSTASVSDS